MTAFAEPTVRIRLPPAESHANHRFLSCGAVAQFARVFRLQNSGERNGDAVHMLWVPARAVREKYRLVG